MSNETMPRPTFADVAKEDLIPNGTYRLRLKKSEVRAPKNCREEVEMTDAGPVKRYYDMQDGEEKYISDNVTFVIQDEGEFLGRHLFVQLTWKPGMMYLSRQLAKALGKDPEQQEASETFNPADFVDYEVLGVVVTQKGYPDRNQVQRFAPLPE